uniref:Uncharacterized protein n=1 Tax=Glossina brevipalpis TaxID=37001 RepID=A0A1A9WQ22_9MUSC
MRTLLRHMSSVTLTCLANDKSRVQNNWLYMVWQHVMYDTDCDIQSIDTNQSSRNSEKETETETYSEPDSKVIKRSSKGKNENETQTNMIETTKTTTTTTSMITKKNAKEMLDIPEGKEEFGKLRVTHLRDEASSYDDKNAENRLEKCTEKLKKKQQQEQQNICREEFRFFLLNEILAQSTALLLVEIIIEFICLQEFHTLTHVRSGFYI